MEGFPRLRRSTVDKFLRLIPVISVVASSKAQALTWEEARQSALTSNTSVQQSNLDLRRSEESVNKSQSGYYPTLKASASKFRSIDPSPVGATTSNRISVTASQNLFAGFSDMYAVRKAEADREAQQASKISTSANLRSALRKAFDNALYLQEIFAFAKRTVARRSENVRIVNLRYDGGRENKSSVLKTQAALLSAEADLKFFESSLELSRKQLSSLMGRPLAADEVFQGSLERPLSLPASLPSHPKVNQAEASRAAAAAAVSEARSGWFPQLTADASAYKSGADATLDPNPHYSIGLTLSVPIFTPSQNPKYADSTIALSKADINLAEARSETEISLKRAQIAYEDAKRREEVSRKIVEATKMQAEVYRQRYTLGMISFQDWDLAESEFIKAERDLLASRQSLADAQTEVELAIGKTLEDPGP